jgi:hypothetical protein
MAGTEWKVDKHLNTMTITLPTSPRVVIRWTADQVDDHLRKLGELRTKMKPPHPRNFALGQVVRGIANAPWATETDTMLGNSILHIRDMAGCISCSQKRTRGNLRPFFKNRWIVRGRDKDGSRVNQMALILGPRKWRKRSPHRDNTTETVAQHNVHKLLRTDRSRQRALTGWLLLTHDGSCGRLRPRCPRGYKCCCPAAGR